MAKSETVIVSADSTAGYVAEIIAGGRSMTIDESAVKDGHKTGPDPNDFLLSALGACTVVTLHMYAGRKNWPLERAEVRLQQETVQVPDPLAPEKLVKKMLITKQLLLFGNLTEEQRLRLEDISGRCPVQRTLEAGVQVQTFLEPLVPLPDKL
ncbi:OsmC family protein [Pontibacter qinzhouensis]|uniref:OsmC family protein n=1 Tax=Pontibacter qinzhouensis TaxID=2603253 RepID=A0A5C8JF80_9BACT|nr:OsmC family protein [Pontibacter qinzhouensis]TXK36960.1 OsmC family protein [Pontibacter qinzhouensis]